MQVQTFEATSIPDALKAVKKELGPDAIILETTEKNTDINGMSIIQVKAAAPQTKQPMSPIQSGPSSLESEKIYYRLDKIDYNQNKLLNNQISQNHIEMLLDQMRELKMLLADKNNNFNADLSKPMTPIFQQLSANGVSETFLFELVKHLESQKEPDQLELERIGSLESFYRSAAMRWMMRKIKILKPDPIDPDLLTVQAFVGPTGSGKTTIVAKIAASICKKSNVKPTLISLDPNGIGASEPLKLYAKVLGINHIICENASQLSNSLQDNKSSGLILIDCSGVNPRSKKEVQNLASLLDQDIHIKNHLILPLTEKTFQLDRYVSYFASCDLESMIFSKLDACWQYGDIFNLSQKWSLPLSYFSTGQEVPNHLEWATKERIIEKIFGI